MILANYTVRIYSNCTVHSTRLSPGNERAWNTVEVVLKWLILRPGHPSGRSTLRSVGQSTLQLLRRYCNGMAHPFLDTFM